MKLILHPSIEQTILALAHNLPQGILLTGMTGVGLSAIARQLADEQLEVLISPTDKDGETNHTNGSISIDEIRKLYEATRSKSLHERVVIIDDIDQMTLPAQNAFLKLLEEPPSGVHFIATAHSVSQILPTIHSRLQTIHIPQTTAAQSKFQLAGRKLPAADAARLLYMASGRPAEMQRLLDDTGYRKKEEQKFTAARTFVGGTSYQKIIAVQSVKTRNDALQFITSCIAIIRSALAHSAQPSLVTQLDQLLIARERIAANGNVKLQLLRVCL